MHDHFDFIDLVNTQMMYSLYVAFVLRFVLITNCNGCEKENELRRTKTKTKHMAKKYQQKKWGRHTTKLQKKDKTFSSWTKKERHTQIKGYMETYRWKWTAEVDPSSPLAVAMHAAWKLMCIYNWHSPIHSFFEWSLMYGSVVFIDCTNRAYRITSRNCIYKYFFNYSGFFFSLRSLSLSISFFSFVSNSKLSNEFIDAAF